MITTREPQGNVLAYVESSRRPNSQDTWATMKLLGMADVYLQWWCQYGAGKDILDKAAVHLCATSTDICKSKASRPVSFHTDRIRQVELVDIVNDRFPWLRNSAFFGGRALQFLAGFEPPQDDMEVFRKGALKTKPPAGELP